MARVLPALVCVLLMLSGLCALAMASGNCTSSPAVFLIRDKTVFEFSGLTVRILPAVNRVVNDVGSLQWSILLLSERNKTKTNVDGRDINIASCTAPRSSFVDFDALQPHDPVIPCEGSPNLPCGTLFRVLDVKDMNCMVERKTQVMYGANVESVVVTTTHPDYPAFKMVTTYDLADMDFEYIIIRSNHNQTIKYKYADNIFFLLFRPKTFGLTLGTFPPPP
jgi:hypothetical protein